MSARRVIWKIAAWLLGIVLVLIIGGLIVVQTPWFQNFALQKIVATVQTATGGRAQIGRFQFDPFHLRVTIDNFVLRGTEPANEAPFFQADRIVVEARLLSGGSLAGISSLEVDRPRVNVLVLPDGTTNIPRSTTPKSNKSPLETVVDLAIGRFRINDGYARVLEQSIPFSGEGENLRVALDFDRIAQRYQGRLDINPLHLTRGNQTLNLAVAVPVVLGRDDIELNNVTLKTPASQLTLSGGLQNLDDPRFQIQANGQIALPEVARMAGQRFPAGNGAPEVLGLNMDARMGRTGLDISAARVALGGSSIDASGHFQNVQFENGTADVRANLVLNQLARLVPMPPQVAGTITMQAQARVRSKTDYAIDGSIMGEGLSYQDPKFRLTNVRLVSTVMADPRVVTVDPLRVDIAGGRITARCTLQDQNRYQVSADLAGFQLQQIAALAGTRETAWGSSISGPVSAEGELKGRALETARANLTLTPNGRGIPLRGQLAATYNGANDSIDVGQSFLALPSSRIDFAGAVNRQMTVRLTSRNLNDFRPALAMASTTSTEMPVQLEQGGSAALNATITGQLSSPVIGGQFQLTRFQVQDRRFDNLSAMFRAASNGAGIENGVLSSGPLQAMLSASVGLRKWKPEPEEPVAADVVMENGDVRDVLALAGQSAIPARGGFTVRAHAMGTVGDPQGSAEIHIRNGMAYSEPIDSADVQVSFGGPQVTLSTFRVTSNMASLDATATFNHPLRDFSTGDIRGHVSANQVALSRIQAVQKQRPGLAGLVHLNADAEATLNPPGSQQRVEIVNGSGNFGVQNIQYGSTDLGELNANVSAAGRDVSFRVNSNFAGSTIRADGQTQIAPDYPTSANLAIQDLPIEQVLLVAGRSDIAAKGKVGVRGTFSGTIQEPVADATLQLSQAVIQKQAIDQMTTHVVYRDTLIDVPSFELRTGPNRVSLSVSFQHPNKDFQHGDFDVSLQTNNIQLAQLQHIKDANPGFAGAVQASIKGKGHLDTTQTSLPVNLSNLDASVTAQNISMRGVDYGGLTLTARESGQVVNVELDSNVAKSTIQANAEIRLAPNYPVSGDLSLKGVQYSNFMALQGGNDLRNASFDAGADGTLRFSGPILEPRRMTGTAEFTRMEATTTTSNATGTQTRQIAIRNDGPIRLAATNSGIEIQQARWTGPSTNVSVTGGVRLEPETAFNVSMQANVDLGVIEAFDDNVRSSGAVAMNATVTGPLNVPVVRGRVELKDAAFQEVTMLNGISKANGVIDITGTTARIQSFTAESGGGTISASGSVSRVEGTYRFDLQARTRDIRVRTGSGVSVVTNANVQLNGSDKNSLLAGDVNVRMISFNSRSDIGSILTKAAPPPETPSGSSVLDSIRLNITIRVGATTIFRTGFAERLEANADLTVRGTASHPGMLGRFVVSQGELVFFGTKYTVSDGIVSFYNPNRIDPILNLNLTTTVRGVSVDLGVSGPVTNMNLSYRSDPPLQFSEIISLLAAGKTPTSDPVLVAHAPTTPSQTLPQMGASALLSAAIANPLAGQLQRVFGVTQLKIDPTFTSGSELPQARLTVQQQITSDLTFTYVTNVTRSDPQIVRVEWAIDDNWSAVATRQENGSVGVDMFYKRRFQ